ASAERVETVTSVGARIQKMRVQGLFPPLGDEHICFLSEPDLPIMQLKGQPKPSQVDVLSQEEYGRQRPRPNWIDTDFLILSDLLRLLERFAANARGALFDYGCGGAPYRSLFKQCERYICADLAAGPCVDRVLAPNGLTAEESATYNVVLSSQVLEHIRDPRRYLAEVHRILKPGGQLILTTHGMFHEHGCPDDFHRWTSQGLI